MVSNLPSSIIPDGAFQESHNVRFGEGWVEKTKGAILYPSTSVGSRINHIGLYSPPNELKQTIVHSDNNAYVLDDSNDTLRSIMQDGYTVASSDFICSEQNEKGYVFVNINNDIYYWNVQDTYAKKLEGTYKPDTWAVSTTYVIGDVVCPTNPNYNGYVYKCTQAGTSGSTEPTWDTGSGSFPDNTCRWEKAGGLEIEGTSALNLRAKCIAYYKGFTIVAHTEEDGYLYSQRLRWSQWQNPTLWHNNSDGSGMAGYVDCSDGSDEIKNIKTFGEYLVVYKENSIQVVSYVGGDSDFERTVVATDVGLLSPRAIVTMPNLHIFIGRDNIYTFNLSEALAIGDSIRAKFFQMLNPSKKDNIFAFYDKEYPEVIFAFHSTTNETDQPDMALTYNPKTKAWGFRPFNYSAIGQYALNSDVTIDNMTMTIDEMNKEIDSALNKQEYLQTVYGDNSGLLYDLDGFSDPKGTLDGYVITKTHHMEKPELLKRLMRIQFHLETQGNYNLAIQIGSGTNAESTLTWSQKYYLNLSSPNPPWIDCDLTARYFAIKFGTENDAEPFKVLGYTLFYQERSLQ